ncbi:MAG: YqaA family protein [Candidatus Competibacteraceae bacterium]|nr:YqaA family protein [Candidatus Competibacteraceae bacterium]
MLADLLVYATLFITAFGAASVLPFYSEPLLVGLVLKGYPLGWLWLVATVGNTLGAVLNWWMARYIRHFRHKRWFPMTEQQLETGTRWFQKYGTWTLLLSWSPVGGDALTFVAGLLRVRLDLFLLLVGIGKGARYAMVIWGTNAL